MANSRVPRTDFAAAPGPRSPGPNLPSAPNEEFVAWVWQRHMGRGRWLEPRGCPPLRVIYPGARRHGRGPDFRDALFAQPGGALLHGDVEVHLRASDWQAHGHQRDARYDAAVLHVVWVEDRTACARRSDGSYIPQLALSTCLPRRLSELLAAFDRGGQVGGVSPAWSPAETSVRLDTAGLARFQAKAAACEADVHAVGADQALYRRLAAALGYGANQRPFLCLADRVPLGEVLGWIREAGAERAAQRLLDWAGLGCRAIAGGLNHRDWVLFGVRPGNLPQRRIHGLCHLVARHGASPTAAFAAAVVRAWQARRPARLVESLMATGLIGPGRAREMVINAVLPWAYAWGELASWKELQHAAVGCYRAFPCSGENAITREAARLLGLSPHVARGACQQQGLIHLYRQRLHDTESWRLDASGQWRWQPWVETPDLAQGEANLAS